MLSGLCCECLLSSLELSGHLLVAKRKALIKKVFRSLESQLLSLMRSCACSKIKFGEYVDTGKLIDKINLPDFLKVYLNHKPPFGNTMSGIHKSFEVLGYTNSKGKKAIRREDFLRLLVTKGEHMTEEEMLDCFASLFGLNPEGWQSEPATSSVKAI
ncbi:hypothetical protein H8959_015444 [Pygathrix nigripes]